MEIRHVEETDLVELIELYRSAIQVQGAEHYSHEQLEAWANSATEESFMRFILSPVTYVAVDDTGPLGFCGYEQNGHIASLYIRPDSSGKGIATALVGHVLEEARAHGINKFFAEASEMSVRVFERYGFKTSGHDEIVVGEEHFRRNLMVLEDEE